MTIKTEANSVLPLLAVPGKLKLITPIKPLYGLTVGCFEIANCGYTQTGVTLKKTSLSFKQKRLGTYLINKS